MDVKIIHKITHKNITGIGNSKKYTTENRIEEWSHDKILAKTMKMRYISDTIRENHSLWHQFSDGRDIWLIPSLIVNDDLEKKMIHDFYGRNSIYV